jgi:hypothetical protein
MAEQRDPEALAGRGVAALVLLGGGAVAAFFGAFGLWGIDGAALVAGLLAFVFGLALAWQ